MKRLTDRAKRRLLKWAAITAWATSCTLLHLSIEFPDAMYLRGFLMFSLAIAACATATAVVVALIVPMTKVYEAGTKAKDEGLRLVSDGQPVRPKPMVPVRAVRKLTRSDN